MTAYIGLIRKEKKSDYSVDFPDFPGCITAGKTLDEAREMANEALNAHIVFMAEDNDLLPEPSTLEKIMESKENKDTVAIFIDAINPYAVKRINLTLREDILIKIDHLAQVKGLSRSSFISLAAQHEIEKKAA